MRQVVRWIATGVFVLFWGVGGVGFLQANVAAWASAKHYDTFLATFLSWVGAHMPDLTFLLENHLYWIMAGVASGFAAGVWFDAVLKRPSQRVCNRKDADDISIRFSTKDWKHPLNTVFKRSYKNMTVKLDGNEFIECVFENVTLVLDGTRPARITDCKRSQEIVINSGNPIVVNTIEVLAAFGIVNKPDRNIQKMAERGLD